jgi:GntR family transcriptional regulator
MFSRPNPSQPTPIYLQLMEQVKHAIETGVLKPGAQLPGIRAVSLTLTINVNTVAKAYRELAHEGVIELRHGAGAFVLPREKWVVSLNERRAAQSLLNTTMSKLKGMGLTENEMRRMSEAALAEVEDHGKRLKKRSR